MQDQGNVNMGCILRLLLYKLVYNTEKPGFAPSAATKVRYNNVMILL